MIKSIYFEISGKCNALCPWCTTGYKNRMGQKDTSSFVLLNDFKKAINYMKTNKMIEEQTIIQLYNRIYIRNLKKL